MNMSSAALAPAEPTVWRCHLPRTTPGFAHACNVLVLPRQAWQVDIADRTLRVQWMGASAGLSAPCLRFACAIGPHRGFVGVPLDLLNWLAAESSTDVRWRSLGSEALALLANVAIDDVLSLLSDALATQVTFDNLACELTAFSIFSLSITEVAQSSKRYTIQLGLDEAACCLVAKRLKDERRAGGQSFGSLKITMAISRGCQVLTASELAQLACGDVVLLDQSGYWMSTTHGRPVFGVTPEACGVRLDRVVLSHSEATAMGTGDNAGEGIVPADQLLLTLVFELARIELTLGELRQCAVGTTLPLTAALDDFVDIRVNGQKIGKGTLISMGDALGVRITRLHDHG